MLLRDSATVFSAFTGSSVNAVATLRRKRRQSSIINAKKIYDEAQMVRRVRAYLQNLNVIEDEAQLVNLSQLCEPPPAGQIHFPSELLLSAHSQAFTFFSNFQQLLARGAIRLQDPANLNAPRI